MANPQFYPLEVNPLTKEPFLRLRNHKNIIITPPRSSDPTSYCLILNDPRVHKWLTGPPIPHFREHAEAWYAVITPPIAAVLAALDAAKDKADLITVDICPVRAIREILDNGEDVYLGDIGFTRLQDGKLLAPPDVEVDKELASRYASENAERMVGDPKIIWTVGDYLTPSHHGQGIMSDALKTVLDGWAIPRMNARRINASALRGNQGSVRVFQKNGFQLAGLRENFVEARGETHDIHVLEWHLDDDNVP
ncbi:hypothetical protein BDZ94DRAFT_1151485 [Collybia nuda]|uniref:N-acetyltransferase domain-containing protein n=1 Tax=Collybia nuda TaxID=64659 RepID=A0A9P5YIS2_9AGAR|nr:hypothetical protein BDZ94DRAFT_1151485 [Collybia nuda]